MRFLRAGLVLVLVLSVLISTSSLVFSQEKIIPGEY